MKHYEYLVAYTSTNGTGRAFITLKLPITRGDDVLSLDEALEAKNGFKSSVTSFQLLREYITKDEG